MAVTVLCRVPLDYREVLGDECTEEDFEMLDNEICKLLPDSIAWCGDELLVELDEDGNIPEELEDFDIESIIDEACDKVLNS